MPLARSFSNILNSFGKVKRATKSVRKDMNMSWKKSKPAARSARSVIVAAKMPLNSWVFVADSQMSSGSQGKCPLQAKCNNDAGKQKL